MPAPANPLEMSDDDFLKMNGPVAEAEGGQDTQAATESSQGSETDTGAAGADVIVEPKAEDPVEEKPEGEAAPTPGEGEAAKVEADPKVEAKVEPKPADPASGSAEGAKDDKIVDPKPATETAVPNFEDFYKKVMAPFKANGKTIELRSPEEAIALMQQGANYTRKMQEIVPHRKVLTMLQNNGLLDEDRISFLIDLDKKNPEAIKKLIKDSGVDPLEIDTTAEPAYLGGNHRVTDEEVNFKTALEELSSDPTGPETLRDINARWDQSSKELLWKHPETLAIIHRQREVGIYDRISTEIDRRRTIGQLSAQTPFLEAYKIVGDELTAANGFADLMEKHQGTAPQTTTTSPGQVNVGTGPKPVATRTADPKPQVSNSDQASAASMTRNSPKPVAEFVNPLAMSDDEFLKKFNGRL